MLTPAQAVERAIAAFRKGEWVVAEQWCRAALSARADYFEALHLLGVVAARRGRSADAIAMLSQAASLRPTDAGVCISQGNALSDLGRYPEALASYDRAIALNPDFAEAYNNRGNVLRRLERYTDALESYDRALALKPDYAEAHSNRGNALRDLMRHAQAFASYERSLALKPDYADAWNNRGNLLRDLGRHAEALESYERALAVMPDHIDAWRNRGVVLGDLKRHAEALASYERALRLDPGHPYLQGIWLRAMTQICDWRDLSGELRRLAERIERSERASSPFAVLALSGSPAIQRRSAEIWVEDRFAGRHARPKFREVAKRERMRIGYFCADFHDHPVSRLTAELFERHDKSRFDIAAFSYGPHSDDPMRKRLVAAFDRFLDVSALNDAAVARLARELEVDIAIDLGGFTGNSRAGIFAKRVAPLQVSYLGYPGTMGAPFIDYLIADRVSVPQEHQRYFSEKIVYLPSFQASDSTRRAADKAFTREELRLPQTGFVFCCFNNSYKIMPDTFGRWMSILRAVPDSVLFLYAANEWMEPNLRREAAARGVDPRRLVFGARLPIAEYLARCRATDLFLDTTPYNAGATANDALWAGLPVLSVLGETFAGRMGASLLSAIGLPELIARTPEQYERLAVELATDPQRLAGIRRKLDDGRRTAPLFDMPRFTRHLEAAYVAMDERQRAGLPPEHIEVGA